MGVTDSAQGKEQIEGHGERGGRDSVLDGLFFTSLPEGSEGCVRNAVVVVPPAKQETQVRPLGREDPLEKEMATHSSFLFWEIPWTEETGRL